MVSDDSKDTQPEPQPQGSEKRRHRRVTFHRPVKVTVPEDSTAIDVISTNVSRGGIFLRANQPLPVGKAVSMDIDTDRGQIKVDEGQVRWAKKFEPIDVDGVAPGMGIEFVKLSQQAEQTIGELIDEEVGEDADAAPPPVSIPQDPARVEGPLASPVAPVQLPPDPKPIGAPVAPAAPDAPAAPVEPAAPARASMKLELKADPAPAGAPPTPTALEENMAAFTQPPPPKTRMFIFVGFVIVVAVLTFLTLMWLKPFDEISAPRHSTVDQAPRKAQGQAPKIADQAPKATDQAPKATDQAPKATDQAPEAADQAPEAADQAPEAADQAPEAADQAPAAGPPVLAKPSFHQAGSGWLMRVKVAGKVAFKTFTLKDPPRLVIDVKGAAWKGPSQINAPAPFVSRIRFGKQENETIRLVLDFTAGRIPDYNLTQGDAQLTIRFP